jgi:hypothetical protein
MTDISQPEVEESKTSEEQSKQAKRTSLLNQSLKNGTTFRVMRANQSHNPMMSNNS